MIEEMCMRTYWKLDFSPETRDMMGDDVVVAPLVFSGAFGIIRGRGCRRKTFAKLARWSPR